MKASHECQERVQNRQLRFGRLRLEVVTGERKITARAPRDVRVTDRASATCSFSTPRVQAELSLSTSKPHHHPASIHHVLPPFSSIILTARLNVHTSHEMNGPSTRCATRTPTHCATCPFHLGGLLCRRTCMSCT